MKRPFVKNASTHSRTRIWRAESALALRVTWVAAGALLWSCSSGDKRPAPNRSRTDRSTEPAGGAGGAGPTAVDKCAKPNTGCPCEDIGETVDCGKVIIRSGDYVTCSYGERECLPEGVWGECIGDQITTKYAPPTSGDDWFSLTRRLAVVGPEPCVSNPCDPDCNYTQDDGQDVTDLPTGICAAPEGGVIVCQNQCRYSGPHAEIGYSGLDSSWQKLPTSCTASADACGYDMDCNDGVCTNWAYPCYDPDPPGCSLAKKIDLELGPSCVAAGSTYHFQVCNRGPDRADSGTLRIGVYSSSSKLSTVVSSSSPGAPDQGYVKFTLGTAAGQYIEPGQCLDITPGNSTPSPNPLTGLTSKRAIAVNYNASIAECNYANNWNAFDASIACTGCTGLECNQTCAATSLTGKIVDPAGVNPVPGVVVYVPNGTVEPFVDGVHCDTCSNLYTGSPIAAEVTDASGEFTLTNVPSGTSFPLVIQIGRWRRQVTVSSIAACSSAALPTGETSRLPSKKSEGDIPKMALSMSSGDHLECLLRKIGIEDSEFTPPSGSGRVHLYAYNGMTFPGTTCSPGTSHTCANYLWSTPSQLDQYNAIIAPCDKASSGLPAAYNPYVGCSSSSSTCPGPIGYAEKPYKNQYGFTSFTAARNATNPLNTDYPPFPTTPDLNNPTGPQPPTEEQQANLKAYIDKGGRLFSTHWMAYFLTKDSYPEAVDYVFGSYVDKDRNPPDFPFTIDTSTELGQSLSDWLGSPTVTFTVWRHLAASVNAPAIRLAYGDSTKSPVSHAAGSSSGWGGPQVSMFQFDTPWDSPAEEQCGRVVVSESHVSQSLDANHNTAFPSRCDMSSMTGEEKAFEFLVFSTTQCVGLVAPPPASPGLEPATYTYDFQANCKDDEVPEWEFFMWRATVPDGTSIDFTAQTADTQEELDTADSVSVGTASETTTIWTSDPDTVDWHLEHDLSPPGYNARWLRISATLNPTGKISPTLDQWQQVFDCIESE
ncbi:MAG: hypothetical protein JW940_21160 [Polyangiaceae bacterium]|nr:hypothetical protein [Polyangiaceae bacterium]